jgi:hypothetical protein
MGSDQALSDSGTPFSSGVDSYTVGIFGQSASHRLGFSSTAGIISL